MRRFKNPDFLRFFLLLLIAELVPILVAGLFLNHGLSNWIHNKTEKLIYISKSAQASEDWSRLDQIKKGQPHASVYVDYLSKIKRLNKTYFPRNDGDVSAIKIVNGEEYILVGDASDPYEDLGRANKYELEAFKGTVAFSPAPYADMIGTHLTACAPVLKNGEVIALIVADFDSASLQNFQEIVKASFAWWMGPALLMAIIMAWFMAGIFVEPRQFVREIQVVNPDVTPTTGGMDARIDSDAALLDIDPQDQLWNVLTKQQKEVVILYGQGLENDQIAQKLNITKNTASRHVKDIYKRLDRSHVGTNRRRLVILLGIKHGALRKKVLPLQG